ncbi:Uncharacterised protein [Enterobacter cloacae]|nr:Uncharacterised protein [Enterobacter cloacae]
MQVNAFAVNHAVSGYVVDWLNHNLAAAGFVEAFNHFRQVFLGKIGLVLIKNHVRQNNRDRLITHYRVCTQYCVPQAFSQALTNLHNGNMWRANRLHFLQQLALNAFFQHCFEFETGIEMVFDRVFR